MEKQKRTKNNIDIYYYPNENTHSFCMSLYIKAGVLYEEDEEYGITHFWEHALFRNINHLMDGKMYEEIDKLGLYFNGATYKEFVQLYVIGAPKHFAAAADILLQVFSPMILPASQIKTEQQRVKAEIREAEDFKSLDYFAGTHAWKDTPLRHPILGTKGNVNGFNKKRLARYHEELLDAGNLFFYVTGAVDEEMMETFAGKVGELEVAQGGICRENLAPKPENFGNRNLLINVKNSPYTMVQFSFDLVTSRYTNAELSLLYDILFSGENALLHQELSEKRGIIYSFSSTLEKYSNIGRLFFVYEVAMRDLYESVEITTRELAKLGENIEKRLQFVLPEYTDNGYFIYDDNEGFNWQRAYENHIMNGKTKSIEETREQFLAVTPKRLGEIAGELFTRQNLVLSLKGDKKKIDLERLRDSVVL